MKEYKRVRKWFKKVPVVSAACFVFILTFSFFIPARAEFLCIDDFDGTAIAGAWSGTFVSTCTADGSGNSLQIFSAVEDKREFASANSSGDTTPRTDVKGEDWSAYEDEEHAIGMWIYSTAAGNVTVRIEEEDNAELGGGEDETRAVETWFFPVGVSGGDQWEFVLFPLVEDTGEPEENSPAEGFRREETVVGIGPGDGKLIGSLGVDVDGEPDVYNPDDPTPFDPQEPLHNGIGDNDHRGVISVAIENGTGAGIYVDYLVITDPGTEPDDLKVERYYPDPSKDEDVNLRQLPRAIWAVVSGEDLYLSLERSTITIVGTNEWTKRLNEKNHPYNVGGGTTPNNGVNAIFATPGPETAFTFQGTYTVFITPRDTQGDEGNVGKAQAITFSFSEIPVPPLSADYTRERIY